MVLIMGVDEAGRGAVIGPLTICGAVFEASDIDALKSSGVRDSKLLSAQSRERMRTKILKLVHSHKVIVIDNKEIDSRSTVGLNLNELEALKIANLIEDLKPDKVYVDSPHTIANKFIDTIGKFLKSEIARKVEIIAEHKADTKYPVVSAASILAKCMREDEVQKIKDEIRLDFGSGYPSDPITMAALNKYLGELLSYVRKTWATYKTVKRSRGQKTLEGW